MTQQYYADRGTYATVPTTTVSVDDLHRLKFTVERWRWVGDTIPSPFRGPPTVILDQSYLYVRLEDNRIARVENCPWPTNYLGLRRDFRLWLTKHLKATGMFWPKAFENLSLFV